MPRFANLKAAAFLALISCSLVAGRGGGTAGDPTTGAADTCEEQSACLIWDLTKITEPGSQCPDCTYEVCMMFGPCRKFEDPTSTFSHQCSKTTGCVDSTTELDKTEDVAINSRYCQQGSGGTHLIFVVKDGASCNGTVSKKVVDADAGEFNLHCSKWTGDAASYPENLCKPSDDSINVDAQCLWNITLPDCPPIPNDECPGGENLMGYWVGKNVHRPAPEPTSHSRRLSSVEAGDACDIWCKGGCVYADGAETWTRGKCVATDPASPPAELPTDLCGKGHTCVCKLCAGGVGGCVGACCQECDHLDLSREVLGTPAILV